MPTIRELTDELISRQPSEMIDDMRRGIGVNAAGGGFTNITGRALDCLSLELTTDEEVGIIRELRKDFPDAFNLWQQDWARKLHECTQEELRALRKTLRRSDRALMEGNPDLEKIALEYSIFD